MLDVIGFVWMTAMPLLSSCAPAAPVPRIAWAGPAAALSLPGYTGAAYYPRLLRLRSGAILCAFDGPVAGHGAVMVARSKRGWINWSAPVVASFGEGNAANAALLELSGGIVLCGYRLVNGADRSLHVSRSVDGGRTWTPLSVIVSAPEGVWEPHLLAVSGGLVAFYATERTRPQAIALRRSGDGGRTWGPEETVVAHPASRDGMPVPCRLGSRDAIVVFEAQDCSNRPFVIRLARSADGYRTWYGRELVYASLRAGKKAGAPYAVAWPDGKVVVSFQTDEDQGGFGDRYCDVKVVASADGGRAWGQAEAPFAGPGAMSAWASLLVEGRDVVVAASVHRAGAAARIEVRRGRFVMEPAHAVSQGRAGSGGQAGHNDSSPYDPRR